MALTFKANSWHYRLVQFLGSGDTPRSLCPYVRHLVLALVLVTLLISLGTFAGVSMVINLLYLTDTLLGLYPSSLYEPKGFIDVATVVGGVINAVIAALALFAGYCLTRNKLKERKRERAHARWVAGEGAQNVEDEPSLVAEWLKAVHGKFCPNIQFE